jgi:hypothetical protein
MHSWFANIGKRKQFLGVALATGLLVGIFVPFQAAEAAVVTYDFTDQSFARPGSYEFEYEVVLGPGESICEPVLHEDSPGTHSPGVEGGTIDYLTEKFRATRGTGSPQSLMKNVDVEIVLDQYGNQYGNISNGCINGPAHITVSFLFHVTVLKVGQHTFTVYINGSHPTTYTVTRK